MVTFVGTFLQIQFQVCELGYFINNISMQVCKKIPTYLANLILEFLKPRFLVPFFIINIERKDDK